MDRPTNQEHETGDAGVTRIPGGSARMKSLNFEHLRAKYSQLAVLGAFAEHYAHPDPASSIVKLRSFAQSAVQAIYIKLSLPEPYGGGLHDPLNQPTFTPVQRTFQGEL